MKTTTKLIVAVAVCLTVVGCSRQTRETTTASEPTPSAPITSPTTTPSTGVYGPSDLDTDANLRQRVIYFDFDQYTVKPEFQAVLAAHAKYLRDRPSARITLEGHADERGSREYNLGLGERRGNAVGAILQSSGQVSVVSYGEERPVATGSNEAAWAQNRRVEIVYTAQ